MGGAYAIEIPFGDFTQAEKVDNGNGTFTYNLDVNLPAQTGLSHEVLHVTTNANGEITGITSVHAGAEMTKESDSAISTWAELQAAMTAGGLIKLTQDITAPANAEALIVPADKTVLLELNGHSIDRALTSAVANRSVIINNGVLAVMDETGNGQITGGNTTGKGGGVYNNGTFTLYSGEITGNHADEMGGGVYNHISNSDTEGFWMTGGLIDGNTAGSYPAIEGEVAFNNLAVVQINATGTTVSVTTAKAHLDVYNYIKPVMPDMSMYAILSELYAALGDDVWTGYGANTGVISYSRGDEQNEFRASFMGGTYTIDIPFGDFTAASKHEDGGNYIYDLTVNLPAQTGMSQETLHVTVNSNGQIEAIHSDIAEIDLHKETNNEITTWAQLQAALTAGGKIKLTHDITAENTDAALEVPMNTTVMLDLNGHSIDRALASAVANGSVIVNNGVLAIMDEAGNGKIKGGKTTGNGGGVLNNGIFTLYAGEITGNSAAQGGGVYNNGGAQGFWMTGGLIDNNTATNGNDAISGNVIFNNLAVVQVDANGTTVSPATAVAGLSHYSYIQPVMPDMEMYAILAELYAALGNDVWTGYGTHTGVISYSRGDEQNEFRASFMGGTYEIEIPFGDFTAASKAATAEGGAVYTLVVSLPAQTGMSQETLHVTVNSNGEIEAIHSDIAEIDLIKETNNEITTWAQLQAAMNAGGMIKLTHDITAENTDAAFEVPANTTVMLDLNGHTIDRALASAVANGNVIVNNGVLAIMDETGNGKIKGGYNSGNGGGIVNNGTFTLYGGKITGNHAAQGAGVYNNVANDGALGFWMTGGLIADNDASSYKAIKGDVTFNNLAVVQVNAQGTTVSAATAVAGLATYDYIKPVMPNMDMFAILAELHNALGNDVWAGYGEQTGVITYAQGMEQNSFEATFMGGAYSIDIPFGDFTYADKVDNGDGTYTYNLDVNLPAQTGLSHEVLHVTTNANGEITGIHSDIAQTDMNKVGGAIASWADLNAAMSNGGVLQLSQSLTAEGTDGALVVPAGKTVVLDLNGFSLDRNLASEQADGCVIINNGTLAITDNVGGAEIKGGYNSGNGGGIVNNGTFTLYGGKITANHAAQGAGVYNSVANNGTVGFWMTGGLIDGNEAGSYPAIKGDVTFSNLAVVQINAQGATVSAATAIAGLATYDYIKPVMPNMDMFAILAELHNALGNDVWAGYGEATGVITYAQGTEPNSFKATFMGGAYAIEIPFGDFTQAEKVDNGNGTYTYNLDVNLPAQTGLSHEVLHVTVNSNGEITGIHSDIAQTDMNKVGGAIATWADLNAAMANGGVLQLSQSLTAEGTDGALVVPAGKTVVLDLNGFSLDRHLASEQADGCVIINNGTLAITNNANTVGEIRGGYNSGNGGGIVNNGTFTLYGGKITGNHAAQGAGVYNSVANDGTVGFWMTGGLIDGNEAASYPAIKGDVTFNNLAVVQVDAQGTTVSAATAIAGLATYDYIKPVMPNMDMFAILAELHAALGNDVWTGYGVNTGVISYAQGDEPNSFKATFMGGTYEIEIPFGDFTSATKTDNGDGTFTYDLVVNLPAQTGMSQETLHVTTNANGEILEMESENAGVELQKETDGTIATWAELQNALNQGGVIKLTNDIVGGNAPLEIPAGKTVVLDLNGHTINRDMTSADANGSVIVNNGTLAIVDNSELANGVITGGKTTDNGGGVLNNGIFTLYAGEITGNEATIGGGVYNNGGAQGFWMTGGLIDGNTATTSNPAIGGDVIFNNMAQIQINADGDKVSIDDALASLATYTYIKPVMPSYDDYATEVAITANEDPDNQGSIYYSTFYDSANKYMLPAGVEAYVADLSGSDLVLTRIAVAGQVIPADEAVILKASVQNFNLVPSLEAPVSVLANNDLEGVDHATQLADLGIDKEKCYVLSGTVQYGVGFYKINTTMLKAHKAYVIYNGSQNFAPKRMRFVFNNEQTATGVENVQGDNVQSTKVIENGVLYIIRDGVKYNVNGQMIK
jgi:stringent starvation protein B